MNRPDRLYKRCLPWFLTFCVFTVAALLVYYPGMWAPFYFDDEINIVDRQALHWREFNLTGIESVLYDALLTDRPVANLSFAVNILFWGLDPFQFRLVNICIHVMTALSLVWCIRLVARDLRPDLPEAPLFIAAAVAGLIFLVHPLNVQAVTYIVQRMTSLAALFSLISLGLFVSFLNTEKSKRKYILGVVSVLFWLLAIGSKENSYVLPVLFLIYSIARFDGEFDIRNILNSAGYRFVVVLLLAFSAFTIYKLGAVGIFSSWYEILPRREFSGMERLLTQSRVHMFYLSLLLLPLPSRLNLDHHFTISHSLVDPFTTLLASFILIGGFIVGLYWLVKKPALGFPLVGYFVLHSIESLPINLELVFEHRMYLPMTMMVLFCVMLYLEFAHTSTRIIGIVLTCIILALGTSTYHRNALWADEIPFLRDSAEKSPGKFRPLYQYGSALARHGRLDGAHEVLIRARNLNPMHNMLNNQLGNIALIRGQNSEAAAYYKIAVESEIVNAEAQYNYAKLLDGQGKSLEAVEHYRIFLQVAPSYLQPQVIEVKARLAFLGR